MPRISPITALLAIIWVRRIRICPVLIGGIVIDRRSVVIHGIIIGCRRILIYGRMIALTVIAIIIVVLAVIVVGRGIIISLVITLVSVVGTSVIILRMRLSRCERENGGQESSGSHRKRKGVE